MAAPRLYMGPLKGFTDHIYRSTFGRHFSGIDIAVAPFVAAINGKKVKSRYLEDLLPEHNTVMPVIPQILSRSASGFAFLANRFYDLGYEIVNWNLGCPYPLNPEKNRAAFLLPHAGRIESFLDAAVPRLKGRISIKARLGWNSAREFVHLIPILNRFPLDEIILHPRTGLQRYEGKPDLHTFAECISQIRHPVVYNGDIRSRSDYQALQNRFPAVDRWMIGRWLLVNPFLPGEIKAESGEEGVRRIERMKGFHDDLLEQYLGLLHGPKQVLDRMKGLWRYFQFAFFDCEDNLKEIQQAADPDAYRQAAGRLFAGRIFSGAV